MVQILQHLRQYLIWGGGSSPVTVLAIFRTEVYCRISVALKSVIHGYFAVMTHYQTFRYIVLSRYLLYFYAKTTFLAGSSNSIFMFPLDLFPINEKKH